MREGFIRSCQRGLSSSAVLAPGESAGFGGMEVLQCGGPHFHQPYIATMYFALHPSIRRRSARVWMLQFCSELWGEDSGRVHGDNYLDWLY